MSYDPEIHHRRSVRKPGYDYSQAGWYAVTICSHERRSLFGEIVDGQMIANEFGAIVDEEWRRSSVVRQGVGLDFFVIMPNHMHGIIAFDDRDLPVAVDPRWRQPRRLTSGSLGAVIGQFKSVSSKRINALRETPGSPVWQRSFYDQIIRTDQQLTNIRAYIQNNPSMWHLDRNNPESERYRP